MNDSENKFSYSYEIYNEPIILSKQILDRLFKMDNSADIISLYVFYYYTAKWQKTFTPKATTQYVAKKLGWTLAKVRRTKKDLVCLGLIEDKKTVDKNNRITGHYIRVKLSIENDSTLSIFHSMENESLFDDGKFTKNNITTEHSEDYNDSDRIEKSSNFHNMEIETVFDGQKVVRKRKTLTPSNSYENSDRIEKSSNFHPVEKSTTDALSIIIKKGGNFSKSKNSPNSFNQNQNRSRKTIPPLLEWVKDYCKERNNNVDAQSFIDFYESKGWMIGKNKMKDWEAAVRTWEKRDNNPVSKVPNVVPFVIDDGIKYYLSPDGQYRNKSGEVYVP